jgi:subtilisin family serine protease
VAPFRFPDSAALPFEGALADVGSDERAVRGIVCAGWHVALFYPERSPATPGGRWEKVTSFSGATWGSHEVSCSITPVGRFAALVPGEGRLLFDDGRQLQLTLPVGQSWKLLASGERFLVVGTKGGFFVVGSNGAEYKILAAGSHALGSSGNHPVFAASHDWLMRAADDGVYASKILAAADGGAPAPGPAVRIPVAPCADEQRCGLSVASDGTWFVAGYWGTFLGKNNTALRQKMPAMALETGGMAVAHQGATGRFVLIGNDDGDIGNLHEPSLLTEHFSVGNLAPEAQRWVVWRRQGSLALQSDEILFPWSPHASVLSTPHSGFSGATPMVTVFRGPLPLTIPGDWVAWEPQAEFAPPIFDISRSFRPTESVNAADWWWVRAFEVDATKRLAAERGISPRPVVVSVVDSGAQLDHPWLAGGLYRNPAEIPGNGYDDDGNGYVDDLVGYDFVEDDPTPQDEFGHGTHVAGLVGGVNPETGAPVALNGVTRVRVLRALDRYGKSNSIDLARAVGYAVDNDSDFLNCSWGGGPVTQVLRDAFAYAVSKHVVVVSSAGNDRLDTDKNPQVPKLFPGVIPVAALTASGKLADFSSWGAKSVAWMAPGDKIQSTLPASQIGEKSGTSMASPIAINAAAWIYGLLKEREPDAGRERWGAAMRSLICDSGQVSGVEGKSQCGRIIPRKATELLFAETR